MPLPSQRDLFDLPRNITYFNAAYIGPLARTTVAAGEAGIRLKSAPWAIAAPDFFMRSDRVRGLAAQLYGASANDIAFVPSVSYGTALAARNIVVQPGQTILCLEDQFPSHVYVWRRMAEERDGAVVTVRRDAAQTASGAPDWTAALLAAIDDRTAAVAVPHCHWTDGSLIDLAAVGQAARHHGAALVLDLTQSLGALPFSVTTVDPDFAISASYKWQLGPYSLGTLYAAPRHHHAGRPLEESWMTRAGAENFARLVDYQDTYQPGARRFDVGETANFHLMPMLEAALVQLLDWGVDQIAETLSAMTATIAERAEAEFGLASVPREQRAGQFLGLTFPDGLPEGLVEQLKASNVFVSVRGTSMRVTPHVYNDADDTERLFEALAQVMRCRAA
ncbi:MAG: aminotransferase class V-fold PLP-dependent enzyme [Pseudomonadota bacterium]